jgi:short-subunit dehydrogenase
VWITGASSGIGRAVALAMAKQGGYRLIVSGRNEAALNEVATLSNALALTFDVTNRQENLDAAKQIAAQYGHIDIALFNAGDCEYVDTKQFDSSIFQRMIQTNFMSMVYGVEAALPLLRLSKQGHLVGMSSAVAYFGLPRSEAYGASKAAICNFLQGLRLSLSTEKILVSIVYPGFIKTPLTAKNDFPMPFLMDADLAAKKIIQGIERKNIDIIVPKIFVRFMQFLSVLPHSLLFFILKHRFNF